MSDVSLSVKTAPSSEDESINTGVDLIPGLHRGGGVEGSVVVLLLNIVIQTKPIHHFHWLTLLGELYFS